MADAILDTHTAIVGASGAGKTVTAKAQVEALLEAGRHVCIVDPTGAWRGLRSNAAGDGPGYPIPIFGGPYADVPVTADQGDLAGYLGMSASGGTFGTYLSRLSGPDLIERDRERGIRLNPDMMGE